MASLVCPDCGTAVPWKASGCAGCGVPFREVRCEGCEYVGTPERFENQKCPRCSKDKLQIVPCEGDEVDEVGDEAFVNEAPLADEIERSFRGSKDKPRRPEERSSEKRREKPKDSVRQEQEDKPPPDRRDGEPPAVLKRRNWSKPEDDDEGDEKKPSPEEKPVRSTKREPIVERKKRRITFDLSRQAQQKLRWAAVGLPVLLVVIVALYFLGGAGRNPKIRHGADLTVVDPGALEAQAAALYEAAVQYYRSGQTEQAIMNLQQAVSQFPLTSAGAQARAALDRSARGLPLFEGFAAQSTPQQSPPLTQTPTPSQALPVPVAEKKKVIVGIPTSPPPSSDQSSPSDSSDQSLIAGTAPKIPGAPTQGSSLAKSDASPQLLPQGFEAVDSAGVHSSGWPIEIICIKDSSHMMLVPAGEFEMGNNNGEINAKPTHRVNLKAFYIDKFEITLLQYKHFLEQRRLEKSPYRVPSQAALAAAPSDKHPVVGIAWRDANAYAEWSGKSLPTEAQWEKAARGSDGRLLPWGSGPPTWEKPREPKQLDRVGTFTWDVSVYGCYDMAGNAWEWCADWYDQNFYHSSPAEDPDGPKTAPTPLVFKDPEKVIRGGSAAWESTWRGFSGIQEEPLHVGFRCVLDIERLALRATVAAPSSTPPPSGRIPATAPKIPPGGYKF